jgi:DNA-binding NarL/FixJ family response regulator
VRDLVDRIVEATMQSLGLSFRTIAARFAPPADTTIVPTPDPDQLAAVFSKVIETSGVSRRVAEVLAAALRGVPRKYLAAALGITEDTVKTHVRQLIRRTGYADLDSLLWSIHGRVAVPRAKRVTVSGAKA